MKVGYGKNVLANILSQAVMAGLRILVIPLLVKIMGVEAFGLIGFFTMLQLWFQLLDLGMTPTLARESARFCGGAITAGELRKLLRTLEGLFFISGMTGALLLSLGSSRIAHSWLHAVSLSPSEVRGSIVLMGMVIAFRWTADVYRGSIAGFERMVWLGVFNSLATAFRFVGAIPVLLILGPRPLIFFGYQAVLGLAEMLSLRWKMYDLVPSCPDPVGKRWDWGSLKSVIGFSSSIAFTSSIWIMVSQLDKVILSKVLPLAEFGLFSLAVAVAGSISLLSGPISGALMPRLTRLVAEGDEEGMVKLYRDATQMVALLVVPAGAVLACFSRSVLLAWTGDLGIADRAAPVLSYYAIGNVVVALLAFQYYLQYAKGRLKLHVIGNLTVVGFLVPTLIWATIHYGTSGAGITWMTINLVYLVAWSPIVHHVFLPGVHRTWILEDISFIAIPVSAICWVCSRILGGMTGRLAIGATLVLVWLLLMAIAVGCSSWAKGYVSRFLEARRFKGPLAGRDAKS